MKKRVFLAAALIALTAAAAFAQAAVLDDSGGFMVTDVGNGSVIITGYKGTKTDINIESLRVDRKYVAVQGIGDGAFKNSKITSFRADDGYLVLTVGKNAFEGCTALTSVTLGDATTIEDAAFKGCTALKSVTFGQNNLTTIKAEAFRGCSSLASITIPASVTTLGNWALGDTGLTSVTLPNGVTRIDTHVFVNSPKLTSVTIPASVTFIGARAFYNCPSLTSVTFGGTLPLSGFSEQAFETTGDIRNKFYAGNASVGVAGRYMRPNGTSQVWTKQ